MDKDAILKLLTTLERQLREQQQQINNLKNQLVHKQHEAERGKDLYDKQVVKKSLKAFVPKSEPLKKKPEVLPRPISRGPAKQFGQRPAVQKSKTFSDLELWIGNYGLQILGSVNKILSDPY